MDIANRTIWQQGSGDTDRDYSDLCLEWDVILNGPGYAGPWPECSAVLRRDNRSARKITDLRRFCEEMQEGDLVVLRLGTSKVMGVGEIVGEYEWCDLFGDIDGWTIQHTRRVRWFWKNKGKPKIFDTYSLKQGDTTQKLEDGAVKKWIASLRIGKKELARPLVVLPNSSDDLEISINDIFEFLFDQGVASDSIAKLTADIGELVRIAKWYQRTKMPSEHETVAYLVVPILRALGWTPQRMAIEWNHVDVALFESLPRDNDSLMIVVEAKKMDASCLSAMSQAMSYSIGKKNCHRLIVTDGLRYGVYVKGESEKFRLYAYMNLTNLRSEYPIYRCRGAQHALLAMAPEWKIEKEN